MRHRSGRTVLAHPACLLGLDVGTTRIKALLMDGAGRELLFATCPSPFVTTADGTEMGAGALFDAVARLLADLGLDRVAHVAAVGVAGMGEAGAFIERTTATSPIIAWHDPRGEEAAERLHTVVGPSLEGRLRRRLNHVSSVAKAAWLKEEGARVTSSWLGVPELVVWKLTNVRVTDPSLACRTGAFDVGARAYMDDVLEAAGIGEVFAEVLPAGRAAGAVTAGGARWSGLPEGIPVTVAGHDHLTGLEALTSGAGDLADSAGTAEVVLNRTDDVPDVGSSIVARLHVSVPPSGDRYVVFSSASRTGAIRGQAAGLLDEGVKELDDLALEARPTDARELLRAVDVGAAYSPPPIERAGIWSALLHELAARTADAAARVTSLGGAPDRLIAFGGGSRSDAWMKARAAHVEIPVLRVLSAEGVARGAAAFAGIAAEWWMDISGAPPPELELIDPG